MSPIFGGSGRDGRVFENSPLTLATFVSFPPVFEHSGKKCACLVDGGEDEPSMLISRSGRSPKDPVDLERDFIVVSSFDSSEWCARYSSSAEASRPSSDTPLHWHSLVEAPRSCGWATKPKFVLHGHSFATKVSLQNSRSLFLVRLLTCFLHAAIITRRRRNC